jgi:urease accessory protein
VPTENRGARVALLHLCDSLFPLGSFAHSDGLEAAVAEGRVGSVSDLGSWLDALLTATLSEAEGPAVREAMMCARAGDFAALAALDDEMDAMRPSSAGRAATRTMGTRLLKTWHHIRPSPIVERAMVERARHTLPTAFGLVCEAAGIGVTEAIEAFMYTRLASPISAAMRLMPVGQHDAHALLARVLADVPAQALAVAASRNPPRAFLPMMDIACMSHQYVHSRLFRS